MPKNKAIFFHLLLFFIAIAFLFLFKEFSNLSQDKSVMGEVTVQEQVEPFSFSYIIIGDTGTGNDDQFQVAKAIENYCQTAQDCQAVFIAGDIIYPKGVSSSADLQFQTKFEEAYENINLPFYIALGNHDNLGCIDCYLSYAETSDKWQMPEFYYLRNFENKISFFVINAEDFDEQQQIWLRENLAQDNAEHKIIVGHRPIQTYEATKVGENWHGKEELRQIICSNADAYVAGHAHLLEDYGWLEDCQTRQLISGAGGAGVRNIDEKADDAFFYEDHGFLVLRLTEKGLNYTFFDENNNELFTEKLTSR